MPCIPATDLSQYLTTKTGSPIIDRAVNLYNIKFLKAVYYLRKGIATHSEDQVLNYQVYKEVGDFDFLQTLSLKRRDIRRRTTSL